MKNHKKYNDELNAHYESFKKHILNNGKIAIWGASGGGDSCYKYLVENGYIRNVEFFIDVDKKKHGKTFHGLSVNLPDVLDGFKDIAILVATSYYIEVIKYLSERSYQNKMFFYIDRKAPYSDKYTALKIPKGLYIDEPESNLHIETTAILRENYNGKTILSDEFSTANYLKPFFNYWDTPELTLDEFEELTIIDCGAYDGDSIYNLKEKYGEKIKKVYALEPDSKTFETLSKNILAWGELADRSVLVNSAASDKKHNVRFFSAEVAGHIITEESENIDEGILVSCQKLDDLNVEVKGKLCIKMDIEGNELAALKGAENLLKKYKPELAICLYHKNEDMLELVKYIKSIVPEYNCIIRCPIHMECYASVHRFS